MMENSKFLLDWSRSLGCSLEEARAFGQSIVKWLTNSVMENAQLCISGFGRFEVRKYLEHVETDKSTNRRILHPPKLALEFTPAPLLEKDDQDNGALHRLEETLANKFQIQPVIAARLSVSFFKTILEAMEEEANVVVDGLGSFLLTKVKVDDSVYGKVVFIPDETLASVINSPFSFFSPVELNESVHFDDLEIVDHALSGQEDPGKVFLISKETASPMLDVSPAHESKDEDEHEDEIEKEEHVEDAARVEVSTHDETDSGMPYDTNTNKPENHIHPALYAAAAVACIMLIWLWLRPGTPSQEKNEVNNAIADTAVGEAVVNDSISMNQFSNLDSVPQPKSAGGIGASIDYAALNAQIPYGGYDIVGVASVIEVTPGMTLQRIAQVYLGTEHTVYLEVLNGGNKAPQPGDTYMIPKLKIRRK